MTDTGLSWFGSQYLNRSHGHALMPARGGYFTSSPNKSIWDVILSAVTNREKFLIKHNRWHNHDDPRSRCGRTPEFDGRRY